MAIVAKPDDQLTDDDRQFLRENYTSTGGLLPAAYSLGAFYTPTHVAKFVVDVLHGIVDQFPDNGSSDVVRWLEPSAGSGVFIEHIPVTGTEITALELDPTSARVTSLLYPHVNVIEGDAMLHDRRDYYDFVIGNPPYGVSLSFESSEEWASISAKKGVRSGKSEVAFIELAVKAAKVGGYIAFVLPKGLNYANYAEKLRTYMHHNVWQVATIGLPGETFALTGTTIETQILILRKAPSGLPLIKPAVTRWGSNFKRGGYEDITDFAGQFLPGQPPAYFAKVTDIGFDKDGRRTRDKWGDDTAQLDELLEDWTDGTLTRSNLYPHIPSWHSVKAVSAFFFEHANGTCDGYRDASRTYGHMTEASASGPYRWQELTLGAGNSVSCPVTGNEYSTWIDGCERWQADLLSRYYE